jgi:glycosyltransferase involved in cell wall biosynthesis
MMKFSIVITTFNRWEMLKRSLLSCLHQTMPCEVIVVDDHSSDRTEQHLQELLLGYGDLFIYHRQPQNLGHAAAVNQGVKLATGDWIKLVDDDDYLADNCIETLSEVISAYSQDSRNSPAVICSTQAIQVDENGQELSRTRAISDAPVISIDQANIHYGMLLELVPFGTPIQVAFSRDAFLQTGGWRSELDTNYDDIDSWIKIAQFGDAIFINQCLGYRTVWQGGLNQKFSIPDRLKVNMQIKHQIYQLVNPQYHDRLPSINSIYNYLHLHWGLIALKQKQFSTSLTLLFPSLFSLPAWQLLLGRKNQQKIAPQIYKIK